MLSSVDFDVEMMERALALARRAMGRTSPNPMVGAVVVKNRRIIGEGYHHRAGAPHAEIHALKAAGDRAKGSDPIRHAGAVLYARSYTALPPTPSSRPASGASSWQRWTPTRSTAARGWNY